MGRYVFGRKIENMSSGEIKITRPSLECLLIIDLPETLDNQLR
jgi:hypothetical protein